MLNTYQESSDEAMTILSEANALKPVSQTREDIINRVTEEVCKRYYITAADMRSCSRNATAVQARRMICYILRCVVPTMTLEQISLVIGKNNHTTAIHHITKMRAAEKFTAKNDPDVIALTFANKMVANFEVTAKKQIPELSEKRLPGKITDYYQLY